MPMCTGSLSSTRTAPPLYCGPSRGSRLPVHSPHLLSSIYAHTLVDTADSSSSPSYDQVLVTDASAGEAKGEVSGKDKRR